jgi:hypothetical protein
MKGGRLSIKRLNEENGAHGDACARVRARNAARTSMVVMDWINRDVRARHSYSNSTILSSQFDTIQ